MSGERVLPLVMDPAYAIDLDTPVQWEIAEHLLRMNRPSLVVPEGAWISLIRRIRLVVSDFDGVLTDNRVWLGQDGRESVTCSREDGLGVARLQASGIPFLIISTERNPVVSERAKKLQAVCIQRVRDKAAVLKRVAQKYAVDLQEVAYIGNDVNDLQALHAAGLAVAVADARLEVIRQSVLVLQRPGGAGAVRELCDLILDTREKEVS